MSTMLGKDNANLPPDLAAIRDRLQATSPATMAECCVLIFLENTAGDRPDVARDLAKRLGVSV